jgi:hypothetical protein
MDQLHPEGRPELRIDRTDLDEPSMIVLGDTGEGDGSQWATVPVLEGLAAHSHFMVIASDVIYPAGGVLDYDDKFYKPYADYAHPIYAIPGNHDWYDGLTGFMFHFCHQDGAPGMPRSRFLSKAWLRDRLWRKPKEFDLAAATALRAQRADAARSAVQPGPYFVLETGPLELVAIDTGITGGIDRDQGDWLRRVSASPKPKILITGKPIYVDDERHKGPIEDGGYVDEVVRRPEHNYIAAIGGDIHNYQRYPVHVGDRVIQYIVSGGGGAFMHATHRIPRIALPGVDEHDFRCYPLRGDSLSFYSQAYERRIPLSRGRYAIDPVQAAAYMGERLGIQPAKADANAVTPTARTRAAAERVFPLPGQHAQGLLQPFFSEIFNWDTAPLFKSLLHIDASADHVRIRCHAATGCVGDDTRAPEDDITATRSADGSWGWQ